MDVGSKYHQCIFCQRRFELTPDNSVVVIFTEEPWLSLCSCNCDHCHDQQRALFGPVDWQGWIVYLTDELKIGVMFEPFADKKVQGGFDQMFGELPHCHQLDEREEHYVSYFHWLLDQVDGPGQLQGS